MLAVLVNCTWMGPQRSQGVYIPGVNEEVGEITVLDDEQVCVQADYDRSLEHICYDVVDSTEVVPWLQPGDEAEITHKRRVARMVEPFVGPQ